MEIGSGDTPHSRVELTLSARGLADKDTFSKSDPICFVEEYRPQQGNPRQFEWAQVGRTEWIQNTLNPEWNKKIQIDYYFEIKQEIRFNLYDIDSDNITQLDEHDFLGRCETSLAEIVAAPDGVLILKIKDCNRPDCGSLIIRAEELDEGQKEVALITIHGLGLELSGCLSRVSGFVFSLFSGFTDRTPFYEIHRSTIDRSRQLVYRSNPCPLRSSNPEFPSINLTVQQLCGRPVNKDCELYLRFYESRANGSHMLIGEAQTSLNALSKMSGGGGAKQLPLLVSRNRTRGHARIVQFEVHQEYSFLDFITSGTQLEFAVAVDFTSSNGNINNPDSLHYLNQFAPNQYEMAIQAVMDICAHYSQSKQFEATGFGARLLPNMSYSDLFPLNLLRNESIVNNVQGVMEAYRVALNNCSLYGPTNFAPTIRHYVGKTSHFPRNGHQYQVLLIITDGQITDMEHTKRAIIDGSELPLSIIIIGVGAADFTNMDVLDSDDVVLTSGGRRAKRDIVQFVPFRKFIDVAMPDGRLTTQQREYVQAQLAKEVLAELPYQVVSYMRTNGITPASTVYNRP